MQTKKIEINSEFIKLDSFLKLAGAAVTGGQAKIMIKDSQVKVNDEICLMRGKKLHDGDRIECGDTLYEVLVK